MSAAQSDNAEMIATDGRASDGADLRAESGLVVERIVEIARTRDRGFWTGLAIASALHALLLIGVTQAVPRQVGDEHGSADGIAINVVSEAELRGNATVAEAPSPPPGPPPSAAEAPQPPPSLKPTQQDDTPPVPAEAKPAVAPEPVAEPAPQVTQDTPVEKPTQPEKVLAEKVQAESALEKAIEKDVPELLALPAAGEVPQKKPVKDATPNAPPKKAAAPAKAMQQTTQSPPQKLAKLDLSPPAPAFSGPAGGGGRRAGLERPPGITRSGANDAFARDVVRALQQTMPQLREVLGRVTVRIVLNENGNVADVQIVRPANIQQIDQSVVFAARQTSYPFPPPNSNLADRTFLITYIYH